MLSQAQCCPSTWFTDRFLFLPQSSLFIVCLFFVVFPFLFLPCRNSDSILILSENTEPHALGGANITTQNHTEEGISKESNVCQLLGFIVNIYRLPTFEKKEKSSVAHKDGSFPKFLVFLFFLLKCLPITSLTTIYFTFSASSASFQFIISPHSAIFTVHRLDTLLSYQSAFTWRRDSNSSYDNYSDGSTKQLHLQSDFLKSVYSHAKAFTCTWGS